MRRLGFIMIYCLLICTQLTCRHYGNFLEQFEECHEKLPDSSIRQDWGDVPTVYYFLSKNPTRKEQSLHFEKIVHETFAAWNSLGCNRNSFVFGGRRDQNLYISGYTKAKTYGTIDIVFLVDWPFETDRLGVTFECHDRRTKAMTRALVIINGKIVFTPSRDKKINVYSLKVLTLHEVGHAMGLNHVPKQPHTRGVMEERLETGAVYTGFNNLDILMACSSTSAKEGVH